jgi:hypothetical protein
VDGVGPRALVEPAHLDAEECGFLDRQPCRVVGVPCAGSVDKRDATRCKPGYRGLSAYVALVTDRVPGPSCASLRIGCDNSRRGAELRPGAQSRAGRSEVAYKAQLDPRIERNRNSFATTSGSSRGLTRSAPPRVSCSPATCLSRLRARAAGSVLPFLPARYQARRQTASRSPPRDPEPSITRGRAVRLHAPAVDSSAAPLRGRGRARHDASPA